MISIIGGGIAGLSAALALQRNNIPCKVYERSPVYKPVGAGIWLAPNAMQVFKAFGIQDDIRQVGNELESFGLMTQKVEAISAPDLQVVKNTFGTSTIAIHRARLQDVLFNQLKPGTVVFDSEFETLNEDENGYQLHFSNGLKVNSKYILGADGIHSKIRHHLFPTAQKRYCGQTCWRGISSPQIPSKYTHSGYELWGDEIRFGFSPISKTEVYWFAVAKRPENDIEPKIKYKENLLQLFKDFDPFILELLQNTPQEKINRNNIEDLKPMKEWHKGGVLLIGDAAHATSPNMGQGGCQAIEDAYYLDQLVARFGKIEDVFKQFRSIRYKKVNAIVNQSFTLGKIAHWKRGQGLRNWIMKQAPKKTITKNMLALYKLEKLENLL